MIKLTKLKTLLSLLFILPFTPITALQSAAQSSPIGSATVTAQGGFALNSGDVLTLSAQIIGCSSNLPLYQGTPVSITPNQTPQSPFTANSSQVVSFTLPGNDALMCGGQNYTMYAVTWKRNGMPVAPTKTYRFADNTAQNLNQLTPIGWVPPVITNNAGINCPSGSVLAGFDVNYQPKCGPVVTTPMPVAASPGQIVASVLAGSNYQAQSNVFFSQNGDTLNSIEAECAAAPCTYVVTQPQTITLTANHTLNSNVNLDFWANGKWTVNGAFTLTVTSAKGTTSKHFLGTATIQFSAAQVKVPVEWFGAVADWNGSSGTDNTSAIQACLNSLTKGQCQLQTGNYKTTAALTINQSGVGIIGVQSSLPSPTLYPNPSPSEIITTSSTADVVDVAGTSNSNAIAFNRFENFTLARSVAPSVSTARGLSLFFVDGVVVDGVTSEDSVAGFFIHGMASQGVGSISHSVAIWGYNGVTETQFNMGGFILDSSNGITNNSAKFSYDGTFSALPHSASYTTFGFEVAGDQTHDAFIDSFESATVDFGMLVSQNVGFGIAGSTDIHITNAINDSCFVTCLKVNEVLGSVEISGGWAATSVSATNTPVIEIDNSTQVGVNHVDVFASAGSTGTPAIKVDSSKLIRLENNNISVLTTSAEDGISFTNDVGGVIEGNSVLLAGTSSTNGINISSGSLGLSVQGNTVQGNATNGIFVASGSNGIAGLPFNTIGANAFGLISNLLVDNGANPVFADQLQNGVNGTVYHIRQLVDQTGSPLCSAAANGQCSFVVTFPKAFPDTNWRQICYAMSTSGAGAIWGGTSRTTTAITVSWHDLTGVTNNITEVVCEGFE